MAKRTYSLWHRLLRLARHRWADGSLRSAFPPALLDRLAHRVAESERQHTGQIRICVEAGLPLSYIRRDASARDRAVTQFGKLRVWDTEHNNGVLIYLLLAEHAIEIVADRGLAQRVPPGTWQGMVSAMGSAFRSGGYEEGLTQALSGVSALLAQHFPPDKTNAERSSLGNELPDRPVVGDEDGE
ncbi:TPM domain-containing protein [Acidovorax sp.]|uniref:TPM domain-containing protein n=1 Tax=Acidovorax sp. TaxID=1872122 RepID=UPI0026328BA1|nr:TPM domain-containing protein [Acidovorax sp.]